MKEFCDRKSFESGQPIVIKECEEIGIEGNLLFYNNPTNYYYDKSVFHENFKLHEMFNKLFNIIKEDSLNTFGD